MQNFHKYFLCLSLLFVFHLVPGQRTITGTVFDASGDPIPGVSIKVIGTSIGTVTNFDGQYQINVPENARAINISFAGYRDETMEIESVVKMDFQISSRSIRMMNVEYDRSVWSKSKAMEITKEAQSLAIAGKLSRAISYLDDQINAVSGSENLATYRAYFLFTKGYLLQNHQNGQTDDQLKSAQNAYREALRYQPGDKKIINNLILVSQERGDYATANRYVKAAIEADDGHHSEWETVSGDLYRKLNRQQEAWVAYVSALNTNPGNRDAAKKLVSMYPSLQDWDQNQLIEKCLELNESGMTELAVEGLESIIKTNCANTRELSEGLLLSWAGMVAGKNWVRPRLTKRLENLGCKSGPLTEILVNISEEWPERLDQRSWWRQEGKRRFYYYAMQKSWADYQLSIGEKKKAMDLYFACKQALERNTDYSKQIYGREGVLEIEVLIQLARLYGDEKLDPTGEYFFRLEESLFGLKGRAYRSNDLKSIQKFHTILGLIYINRKKWEGDGFQNAMFQLERAIETANQRVKKDSSIYTPLPHLYKNLGDTYQAIGLEDRAGAAYLDAAVHYLETDNLPNSEAMIMKAREKGVDRGDSDQKATFLQVKNLYEARTSVHLLDKNQYDPNHREYYRSRESFQWLNGTNQMNQIDASIVERQKFKVLSDLSQQARKVGADEEQEALEKEAKKAGDKVVVLSSYQDVVRLKRVTSSQFNADTKMTDDRKRIKDIRSGNKKISPDRTLQQKQQIRRKNDHQKN